MTPTPHINASFGDFAETVLMPGDPLRSRFAAENFLSSPRLVNNIRAVQGYTGSYKGVPVSIMASGMGMPSIGIYSHELFSFFGVKNIIRIGSAGALQGDIKLKDIVIGQGACTNSAYEKQFRLPGSFAPICDYGLLRACTDTADKMGLKYHVGNLLSSDTFYCDDPDYSSAWAKMGVAAVEMEAAALYMNALRLGRRAIAICTVSDNIITGEQTTAEERQTGFSDMIRLALEVAAGE